jgi:predicted DNA-binding transcriptional regulator AlpA
LITFLTVKDLPSPLSRCSKTIMGWVREGRFPPPIKIGRTSAWRSDAIEAYLNGLQPIKPGSGRSGRPSFTSEEARAAVNVRWARHRARQAAERGGRSDGA